jgi:hypothetical protein
MNLTVIKAGAAELAETLKDPQTLTEVARVSFSVAPAIALVVVGSALEDRQAERSMSRLTKASVAGLAGTLAAGAAAFKQL